METFVALISAAGLGGIVGGIVTSFVQAWLSRKAAIDQRKFAEKKDAYINLLNAVHLSEIAGTEEAAKNVGHWGNVCDLVANESVRHQLDGLFSTNPESDGSPHPERPKVLAALKAAMRDDLGIETH